MPFDQKFTRSPEYLSVHPLGRVPCLVHNDLTLYESGAICQYLCEIFDKGDQLGRSVNHIEHAEWLQWLHYAETIAVHGASLVQQNIIIAEELRSPIVIKLESRRLEKTLEVLDNHLQGREYLLKSGFSAIDTSVGYSIHMGSMFTNISDSKNIKNYYDKLKNRAAFKKSLPKDINDPLKNIKVV